jgi:hypothetical protein
LIEENQSKSSNSLEKLEEYINIDKEVFEEEIQGIQKQMINEETIRDRTNRVVEVSENGQETVCKEIRKAKKN